MLFSDLIWFELFPGMVPTAVSDVRKIPSGEAEVKDAKKGIRAKLLGFYDRKNPGCQLWLKTIDEFWEGKSSPRKRHRSGWGNLATPSWERLQLEKPLKGLQQPSQVKLKDDPAKTKPY